MDNYENPKVGKTYISPSLTSFGDSDRRVRIASKVIESPDSYAFAQIKGETILRHREGAKTHIKATFLEDSRKINVLNIQGYTVATKNPHNACFSFIGDEIGKLIEFINNIQSVTFKSRSPINISDEELRKIIVNNNQAKNLVKENQDVFAELMKSELTKEDIVAVGYRKKQLEVFRQLLEDPEYFETLKKRKQCGNEGLWQQFFEKNTWIFGYGLGYVQLSSLNDRKL